MALWYVIHGQDEDNLDFFVTAPTAIEAFVIWRLEMAPAWDLNSNNLVRVFLVPDESNERYHVHTWKFESEECFSIGLDTLATKAIEAELTLTTVVNNKE